MFGRLFFFRISFILYLLLDISAVFSGRHGRERFLPIYETVGKVISKGDIVVYESTVYPGVTEDAVILGVAHKEFLKLDIKKLTKDKSVIYDVKGILDRNIIDGRL